MKVSIITPNYNGKDFLDTYFKSLNSQIDYIGEVIIIDNGSTDGSLEFINQEINHSNLNIKLIENKSNLGFAKAVNQGISIAKSEFLFLLNNDVELEKKAIFNLVNCLKTSSNAFSVSSKMVQFNNRNLIDDAGDEYTLFAWTKKAGDGLSIDNYSIKREIFSSCGGAALYRKSVFEIIGGFDENFFAYMEDVDIALRSQINGLKNYYCPEAIVYHIGSGSSGSRYNPFKIRLAARNNVWVVYKNFPIILKIINFVFLFVGFLIKFLFFSFKGYGKVYLDGLKEGLSSRNQIEKVKFNSKNTKNYFKLEWKLIVNTFYLWRK